MAAIQAGEVPLVGRTEAEVAADVTRRLLAEGHHQVNFAIVAAGPNAASPHHEPGDRRIEAGEGVLCDFGGTVLDGDGVGYCSDITRCVALRRAARRVPGPVHRAAGRPGPGGRGRDGRARRARTSTAWPAGSSPRVATATEFVHRTGHGIGIEAHEDPYVVAGNCEALVAGHAFSVEPGIYVEGRWGARIEDIVVATDRRPRGPQPGPPST